MGVSRMTCERCGATVAALEYWVVDGVAVWLCEVCVAPLIVADADADDDDDDDDDAGSG